MSEDLIHCYGCDRPFQMSVLAICRHCGDLFCASCSDLAVIDGDKSDLGVHVYCTACVAEVKESRHEG